MCFSAVASFTSAALLGAAGLYLVQKYWGDRRILIAWAPLFFALQQFSEGWLWVGLENEDYGVPWTLWAEYSFLFFAYMFWPVWIPLAALHAETEDSRRMWFKGVLALGLILAFGNGIYLVKSYPIEASIVNHSISYGITEILPAFIYAFVVISPFFITSLHKMKAVGVFIGLSFLFTLFAYAFTFTSIWCFVAAITTLLFLFVLERDQPSTN